MIFEFLSNMFAKRINGILHGRPLKLSFVGPSNTARLNIQQRRTIKLTPPQLKAVKGWGTIFNIITGAYIGGLIICFGLLYFLYQDANDRQHIPFELSFRNQITAVKAINKDDVLKSPRYAVKHYRRLLIELAKEEDPNLSFDEGTEERNYNVPLLDSSLLLYHKSKSFSNFYIDIVLRYAKALLAKGRLEDSMSILRRIIDDEELFYKLGDTEKLSQGSRLLSNACSDPKEKVHYLERAISMIQKTLLSIRIDQNFVIQDGSRITDELLACLDRLAFTFAKVGSENRKQKEEYLTKALNIYLSNLKTLVGIQRLAENGKHPDVTHPMFNCSQENLIVHIAESKAHISEIMWAKGYKKNAVAWSEDVLLECYNDAESSSKISAIVVNVLRNLSAMYGQLKDLRNKARCDKMLDGTAFVDYEETAWYDRTVNRFSKIIFNRGPLGVVEKSLLERIGRPKRIPEIEEFEDEDEE